ncbi:MAG: ATP-dependent zinc metalloprotease FtsH [Leptonema illini]|jgi:cell division protease FtsH|uniref:ATP-dependent zinc metalloprotease FtsH n=2 Tax=Leptonema illini TaxID=183 RepID=H2CEL9_9LEPT|nr:ATP-dependent zinc metalloprotease FtsH [Leptonema illini]EHQ06631.1 membrane protease FtsH catalytic subunit [Leptonema illini DSM 21528]KAB2933189.1 MAG: ATP-dependent zinc metalloprotease FtsH [Leptonema illini]PKL33192.1 MAG: ATP-dependent zinc metalloprotease FtsH [Spirochaetae bacterium HGW-Spirochaetae-10]
MNKNFKFLLLIFTGVVVLLTMAQTAGRCSPLAMEKEEKLTFSEFRKMIDPYNDQAIGNIYTKEAMAGANSETNPFLLRIGPKKIEGRYVKKGQRIEPTDDVEVIKSKTVPFVVESMPELINEALIDQLDKNRVHYRFENPDEGGMLGTILQMLPFIIIVALLWMFMIRQIQSTGNKAMAFGKSKAKLNPEGKTRVTFTDVAGCDEAKEELVEVVDFLKDPRKFQTIGARIPRGVLLVGPPGTGKTLLARAVAGEAGVPFYSISGSDFVEMFVGVGASRVRDLFEQAKKNAPCIIFIDEIDAVGRLRGAGLGGGHDEREQTLNQLLVEMDGFEENEGVIVVAATNRPDVLDPALLRPGRFDRQVVVDAPDVKGREEILRIHARKVPMTSDVSLSRIARGTPGFTGADLANLINEAALLAARKNKKRVTQEELEEAKDKVIMGPERRSILITEKEKEVIAYHEGGHALLGTLLPYSEPVHKVTIIPRGRALGLTQQLPEDDRHIQPKKYWLDRICVLMGGYLAEGIIFNDTSTGASNDIQVATNIARRMVCEWGMSEKLGTISYSQDNGNVFLGREISSSRHYSEETAAMIDGEVKRFVQEQLDRGRELLTNHREKLERIAKALLERESIGGEELNDIMGSDISDKQKRAFSHDAKPPEFEGGAEPAPAT